jgi:hypothetical protein
MGEVALGMILFWAENFDESRIFGKVEEILSVLMPISFDVPFFIHHQ